MAAVLFFPSIENQIPLLCRKNTGREVYTRLSAVSLLKNLINDIHWVLFEPGYIPSTSVHYIHPSPCRF